MPEIERDDQADEDTPEAETDERAVSWGPTWGPETGDYGARPAPVRSKRRGWHPPGGPL